MTAMATWIVAVIASRGGNRFAAGGAAAGNGCARRRLVARCDPAAARSGREHHRLRCTRGLVVVDTGRHDMAQRRHPARLPASASGPIVAILNTHWHLDHSSGNGRIKAAFPDAPVYTTNAVDRVLAEGGFLARNLESCEGDARRPEAERHPEGGSRGSSSRRWPSATSCAPMSSCSASGERAIGGRDFDVHVTDGAVTDADLWLYDGASGVAVIGDLVTLPAPFFETACPARVAQGAR